MPELINLGLARKHNAAPGQGRALKLFLEVLYNTSYTGCRLELKNFNDKTIIKLDKLSN